MSFSSFLGFINLRTTAEIIGAAVGLFTLIKGTLEYVKQGTQKRIELYFQMVEKFSKFSDICALLECQETARDVEKLRMLPYEKKFDFVGFFEDLALMAENGLIRYRLAHYVFGFYAIMCWESDNFWNNVHGMSREEPYWRLFRAFVERMQKEKMGFLRRKFEPKMYRV
jgi:hypothetical protein